MGLPVWDQCNIIIRTSTVATQYSVLAKRYRRYSKVTEYVQYEYRYIQGRTSTPYPAMYVVLVQ